MLVIELHLRRREMKCLPERIALQTDGVLYVCDHVPNTCGDDGQNDKSYKGRPEDKQKKGLHETDYCQCRHRATHRQGADAITPQGGDGIEDPDEECVAVGD